MIPDYIQMEKPSNLLIKLSRRLFDNVSEQEKFIEALINPKSFSSSILWCRKKPDFGEFNLEKCISWQPDFVERLSINEKPGKHPLHEQGYFYCLDFSSVFAAASLLTIPSPVNIIFDMCAAPGGKSIFACQALQPKLLISNEVIGKRLGMLISNLKRCIFSPYIVFNQDSNVLIRTFLHTSEVVIVDAPCTGQSLLAKGGKAPGCFHPMAINKSANRQKRIIANSAQIVAPGGYLAYMTCTYSTEENEDVCQWFLAKFPQFQPLVIPHLSTYQSHLTTIPCYRMFPQDGLGAGAFTVLFQNTEEGTARPIDSEVFSRQIFVGNM